MLLPVQSGMAGPLNDLPPEVIRMLGDVDLRDEDQVRARIAELMATQADIDSGRVRVTTRKVRRQDSTERNENGGPRGTGAARATSIAGAGAARYETNYSSWDNFDPGDSDGDESDDGYIVEERLEEVPREEQLAEAAARTAATSAQRARDEGNELFNRGDYAGACQEYWKGLRYGPSAALLANRAMARLKVHDAAGAASDASKALRLDASHVKARMRRASALQQLGRLDEALADCQRALELEPTNGELLRLRESIAYAKERAVAAQALSSEVADARIAKASGALGTGSRGAQLLETEECVARLVAHGTAAAATAAGSGARTAEDGLATTKAIRFDLTKLRRLLGGAACNSKHFAALGGVRALAAVYGEDNLGVLATLAAAASACDEALDAITKETALVGRIVGTVGDRRVAVIDSGLELLEMLLERKVRAATSGLATPATMTALSEMMAKGPASLRDKAAAVLAPLMEEHAPARKAARGCGAALAAAVARGAAADNPKARLCAAMLAAGAAGGDSTLCERMGTQSTCDALLKLLDFECRKAPETRNVALGKGIAMSFRAVERLADGTRRAVQGALEALAALCKRQEFVELLHASPSGWLQVVPLLRDSSAPVEAAAALVLARACARAPEVSPVVAELGASGALLELVTAPEGACSMGTREAAAEALMACSTTAAFQQEMSQSGAHGGIDAMVAMLNHATPHKLLLCISRAVEHALRHDAAKLADVFSAHPCLLETLIDLWYARTGECQEAVEGVLWLVLAEESGAKYLTGGVEEEQLAKFLEDFKALNRARAAAATGGASLQRDADEEYTALGEFQSEATTRDALANRFDCVKAARYMRTLLPPKPTVAVLGDKTGALTCNLAEALAGQSMEAFCYCALETRMWAEFVESRVGARELKRLIGVVKTDSASDVTALPVPVDLIVVSCNAYTEIFGDEDASKRQEQVRTLHSRLNPAGKVVVVEEFYDTLVGTARKDLESSGFAFFSMPDVDAEYWFNVYSATP